MKSNLDKAVAILELMKLSRNTGEKSVSIAVRKLKVAGVTAQELEKFLKSYPRNIKEKFCTSDGCVEKYIYRDWKFLDAVLERFNKKGH